MAGDDLRPATDHDLMDIAADLNLVMGKSHRHRIVIASITNHRDRRRPSADLLAGIVARRRQRQQLVQIAQQPLADRFAMTAHDIVLPLETLRFQPGIQIVEAGEPGRRYKKIPPTVADHTLDMPLVVPLAGPAKLVLEQVMRLQLAERPGPHTLAVAKDLGHGDRGVVVQHRQRHTAEERERRIVTVTEGLGRLPRIGLHEDRVRVRQRHREIVQLALHTADHPKALAEIHLGMPGRVAERDENLLTPPLLLTHIIGDDRDPARIAVLVTQPLENPLARMTLLLQPALVLLENLIDHRRKRIQLRTHRLTRTTIPGRYRMLQDLRYRLAVDPELTSRLTTAHPVNVTRTPNTTVQFHRIHPRPKLVRSRPQNGGFLLRCGQTS